MQWITRFSMKNAVAVFILVAMLVSGGLYSVRQMKMEKYPPVDIPYLHMNIVYPGASPEQVMQEIGKPMEQELAGMKGIVNLYSGAQPNVFYATMQFGMSKNMNEAERETRTAVSKVRLPEGAGGPEFTQERLDSDVFSIAFYGGSQEETGRFVQETLHPQIRTVPGIERIGIRGPSEKKVFIRLRPDALRERGLSLDQVKQLMQANNSSIPVGDWVTEDRKLPIRTDVSIRSLDDIKAIPLFTVSSLQAAAGGSPVQTLKLEDIADVTYEAPVTSYTRLNGESAVVLTVFTRPGDDAVRTAQQIKDIIGEQKLPSGVRSEVLQDRSVEIEHSVNSMLREVLLGALTAVIVTLIFLRNIRSTIIAIISIPLSMLASFIILSRLGYTLNMMTLAGIAVAIGRVVDDSIVVMENIFRRVRGSRQRDVLLVEHATHEVASAITSSTITTVAVFLPLAFVPGIVGKFFVPLAWTIVISLLFSLLVAITVVPLMSRLFLMNLKHQEPKENALQRWYRSALQWTLRRRWLTLASTVVVAAVVSGWIAPMLGTNFLPTEKVHKYVVQMKMPIGTALPKTEGVASRVESILRGTEGVATVSTDIGVENASFTFTMKEEAGDSKALAEAVRNKLETVEGAKSITVVGVGGIDIGSNMALIVNGPNTETIRRAAEQIVGALQSVQGLGNVRSSAEGEKPEIVIDFDQQKLAAYALTPAAAALSLRNMVEGASAGRAQIEGKTVDVNLSVKMENAKSIETLKQQLIISPLGVAVSLQELGTIKEQMNPTTIAHLNQNEYLEIYGTITDPNAGQVNTNVEKAIQALTLPDGVTWSSEGAAKEINEGFSNMFIALGISVFLVYMVMLIAFGDWKVPLIILISIPLYVMGALLGLYAVKEPIGMPAMIGVLMLNGIVVTNAIVLLERVLDNMKEGMRKREALLEAGATRIQPILMTAVATIGALVPLVVSTEAGLVSRALAVVVIGGLTTSTFLTLIIVPILFSLFVREPRRRRMLAVEEAA